MVQIKIGEMLYFKDFFAIVVAYAPRGAVKVERLDGSRFVVGGYAIDRHGKPCRRLAAA